MKEIDKNEALQRFVVSSNNILRQMKLDLDSSRQYLDFEKMQTVYKTIMSSIGGEKRHRKLCELYNENYVDINDNVRSVRFDGSW